MSARSLTFRCVYPADWRPTRWFGETRTSRGDVDVGAAAIANRVRRDAPSKVHEFREQRAAERCVIVTKVEGRYLASGPYKDGAAAQQDIFNVGGTPHVAELKPQATFFARRNP